MMSESEQGPAVIRFSVFELDPAAGELRRSGRLVPLTGQPMRVLVRLVARAGQVVTREELQREIWGGDTHVDFDAGLSTCINQIRSALGDRAGSPRFVETLPRRGYRFMAPLAGSGEPGAGSQGLAARSDSPLPTPGSRLVLVAATLTVVLSALLISQLRLVAPAEPIPIVVIPVEIDSTRTDLAPVSTSLTEVLIGKLAEEAGERARVASRQSVEHLRGQPSTLDDLRKIGAEYFVSVSLRSAGGPVLVHAKLAHITGWIVWTSDEELPLEVLERDQLRIASTIATRVSAEILPSLAGRRAPRPDAVADYAQAKHDLEQGKVADSLAGFERALAVDPNHPGTLAGLAEATIDAVAAGLLDRRTGYETAARHAQRALDLDPTNPRAMSVLRATAN